MILFNETLHFEKLNEFSMQLLQILPIVVHFPQYYSVQQVVVVAVYRSPQLALTSFSNLLSQRLLPLINHWQNICSVIVIGDFNVDFLDKRHFIFPIPLKQFVSSPTCITGSLLDHVYWSGKSADICCRVTGCYWSDHFFVNIRLGIGSSSMTSWPISHMAISHSQNPHAQCSMLKNTVPVEHIASRPSENSSAISSADFAFHQGIKKQQPIIQNLSAMDQSCDNAMPRIDIRPIVTYNDIAERFDHIMGNQIFVTLRISINHLLHELGLHKMPVRPDGHCLLYSWEIATGTSLEHLKQMIMFEHSSDPRYENAGVSAAELQTYITTNTFDLQSIDAVVDMLSNAFAATVYIIDGTDELSTSTWKIFPRSVTHTHPIFLLKTGSHYDALVCNQAK